MLSKLYLAAEQRLHTHTWSRGWKQAQARHTPSRQLEQSSLLRIL